MKKLVIILIFCFFLSFCSAIRINEIEANPSGTDSGNEWLELFSESEISLDGYKLVNNDGNELLLNQTTAKFSRYFIVEFEKQFLDNKDEKVFLYYQENIIDETEIFSDSKNNNKTWQFCDKWEFKNSTKEGKNNCEEKTEEQSDEDLNKESEEKPTDEERYSFNNTTFNITDNISIKKTTKNIINLNKEEQSSEVIYESKNEKIKKYSVYAFALLLIFIIIILIIKR